MWILFTIIYIIFSCLFRFSKNEIPGGIIMSMYILMVVYIYNNIYHIENLFLTILLYVYSCSLFIFLCKFIYNSTLPNTLPTISSSIIVISELKNNIETSNNNSSTKIVISVV